MKANLSDSATEMKQATAGRCGAEADINRGMKKGSKRTTAIKQASMGNGESSEVKSHLSEQGVYRLHVKLINQANRYVL